MNIEKNFMKKKDYKFAKQYCKDKKFYMLADEHTMSKAEIILLRLMNYTKGTVIGRPTAGVSSMMMNIPLIGKNINYTHAQVYDYKNKLVSGKGIIPDILVVDDIESIREEKDKILETALKYIYEH
jgi:C-terminal processing protease CtpA/Prc